MASGQISDISSVDVSVGFASPSGVSYQTQLKLAASTDYLEGTLKIPVEVFPEDVEPGPDTALSLNVTSVIIHTMDGQTVAPNSVTGNESQFSLHWGNDGDNVIGDPLSELTIVASGGDGADLISGGVGLSFLSGGAGNDNIFRERGAALCTLAAATTPLFWERVAAL